MTKTYRDIPQLTLQEIERFWSYVDKTPGHGPQGDCWIWTGARCGGRYGGVKIRRRMYGAHRVAFYLLNGFIDNHLLIRHTCNFKKCVRHLIQGTQLENMRDEVEAGRTVKGRDWTLAHRNQAKGERTGTSKLIAEQVLEIRAAYAKGNVTLQALADKYGVDMTNISMIVRRKSWTWLE